jgi:ATP-dependent DNA helicase RecQ
MILRAGFASHAVLDVVNGYPSDHVDWPLLLAELSKFQVYGLKESQQRTSAPGVWSIVADLISRGAPTLCSLNIENLLQERTGLITDKDVVTGTSTFKTRMAHEMQTEHFKLLFRAMLPVNADLTLSEIIDAVNLNHDEGIPFGSDAEKQFFAGPLCEELGLGVLQFVQAQRALSSLSSKSGSAHYLQRADFTLDLLCSKVMRGLILEIDGPQHQQTRFADNARDGYEKESLWHVYRRNLLQTAATVALEQESPQLRHLRDNVVFKLLRQNYVQPLVDDAEARKYRHLVYLPLAIARLQRVLVSCVLNNTLKPSDRQWRVAVVDRDMIGDDLNVAFSDLKDLYTAIAQIHGCDDRFPSIVTTLFTTWSELSEQQDTSRYDLIVDLSIDLKTGQRMPAIGVGTEGNCIVVRSVWGVPDDDNSCCSLGASIQQNHSQPSFQADRLKGCEYILQNVFRKRAFREKQYEVIERLLDKKSVIALMPTGAGKSLTYQLAGIVSCGAVVVVDPIRSLMKDQVDTLKMIGIDYACSINSWLQASDRKRHMDQFLDSRYKFLFISPERMFISEFRNQMIQFTQDKHQHFAFAVIDEAHCVSEWGHDFRTTYLRLGINFRKYLSQDIPFAALTGTASFEVLDDVKIELGLQGQSDVDVRPSEMRRHNLTYHVVAKSDKLKALPESLDRVSSCNSIVTFLRKDSGSGLVFAPHISGDNGVQRALTTIGAIKGIPIGKLGLFYGGGEGAALEKDHASKMIANQSMFKSGAIRLMCCTKAFGMGIDKPDVRHHWSHSTKKLDGQVVMVIHPLA